jgi:DNA-binding NtrC family response regulator
MISKLERRVLMDLFKVLVMDTERSIYEGCCQVAESLGFQTFIAETATAAYQVIDANNINIVVLDIKMTDADSPKIILELKRRSPEVLVIIVTTCATNPSIVNAMRADVFDYVAKPLNIAKLRILLRRAWTQVKNNCEDTYMRDKHNVLNDFSVIIGGTSEMRKLYRFISRFALSNHPVMIYGESGTEKELVARSIHLCGPYPEAPFIPLDCRALVPALIEYELFGYEEGAFNGAVRSKDGLLQIASGGTVFLDDIEELPFHLQSKLLRAIQEKVVRAVGSSKRIPINVRIQAATNRDLKKRVMNGTFRKDLYFRLNVMNLQIPPLRERLQDIPILANHILNRISRSANMEYMLTEDAIKLMMAYDWPGNVRELENCVERAVALSTGRVLHVSDMPSQLQNVLINGQNIESVHGGIIPIAELEKRAIISALSHVEGDKFRAAELLGIGKTTLYRKLKMYRVKN